VQRTIGETTDQDPSETSINVPIAQWLADNGSEEGVDGGVRGGRSKLIKAWTYEC
jgi:hypothetical protein